MNWDRISEGISTTLWVICAIIGIGFLIYIGFTLRIAFIQWAVRQ